MVDVEVKNCEEGKEYLLESLPKKEYFEFITL